MTDMIMFPEDPDAPRPATPRPAIGKLRNATTADWVMEDGLTARYNSETETLNHVGVATRQQVAGLDWLRHDPPPPNHLVAASLRHRADTLDQQAAVYEAMLTSMEAARRKAIGNDPGETGAMLAAVWAGLMAARKRSEADQARKQANELGS
ncbi:hypothetical protein [Brevundimonas sp.]|uniref:hypothetical protein n=1 Tax=Brevundimonas sp. TaxID=1871086 RepID=UPI00289D613B|nr:hypothetical protein [Brevundimonas sp.]